MALTKFNFNSFDLTTVASTGLAFNSSANGFDTAAAGAMTLISTNTISSGVSSSSFTSGIDSTYDTYVFKIINCHPASDAHFTFNGSTDGGSNYNVTKTSTNFVKHYISVTNGMVAGGSSQTSNNYNAGYINTTSAINAIDFKFSSGNIDSGVIKMYGITK